MKPSTRTVLIGSYLEPEHIERIRQADERLTVLYEPKLLRPPRYAADHNGDQTFQRTSEQEARWRGLLAQAEILFDRLEGVGSPAARCLLHQHRTWRRGR